MLIATVTAAAIALAVEGLHLPDTLRYFQSLEYKHRTLFPVGARQRAAAHLADRGALRCSAPRNRPAPIRAWIVAVGAAFWVLAALAGRRLAASRRPTATKPLATTARARRILAVAALLLAGEAVVAVGLVWGFRTAPGGNSPSWSVARFRPWGSSPCWASCPS